MKRAIFVLPVVLIFWVGSLEAQSDPANCERVHGALEIPSISDDTIDGKLEGDLEGTVSLTVLHRSAHSFGPITLRWARVEGTITTADGTLDVSGRAIWVEASLPGGEVRRLHIALRIQSGDGVFAGARGRLRALAGQGLGGMTASRYRGVVCAP